MRVGFDHVGRDLYKVGENQIVRNRDPVAASSMLDFRVGDDGGLGGESSKKGMRHNKTVSHILSLAR